MSWLPGNPHHSPPPRRSFIGLPSIISFAIAILVLAFFVTRFDVNLGDTWQRLKDSNLVLFALAVAVHYTTFLFRGARWRVLLQNVQGREHHVPGVLYFARLILLAWFVNAVTWFRLGDAYRAYAYSADTQQSFSRTMGTVLAERVLDVAIIFFLVVVAALLLVADGASASWLFVGIAAALVGLLVGVLVAMGLFGGRLVHHLPNRLQEAYHRFHQGTLGSFQRLPLVAILGLLSWSSEVGRLYLVSRAIDVDISFGLVVFVTVANSMLTLIPLTPGGLGLVEPGVIGLLRVSLEKAQAVPLALLDRSISYLSIIVTGGALFLALEIYKRRRSIHNAVAAKGK